MKTRHTVKQNKVQLGFRLEAEIAKRLRALAEADDRQLTYIVKKALKIALPILEGKAA